MIARTSSSAIRAHRHGKPHDTAHRATTRRSHIIAVIISFVFTALALTARGGGNLPIRGTKIPFAYSGFQDQVVLGSISWQRRGTLWVKPAQEIVMMGKPSEDGVTNFLCLGYTRSHGAGRP